MLDFTLSGNTYFDGVPQPVLLAQGGKIKYYNPAAKELFALTDTPLEEEGALPINFPQEGETLCGLKVAGRLWTVRSQTTEAGILYLLHSEDEHGLSKQRLGHLAMQLRLLLSPLGSSIEMLQKSMVETEQVRNNQWITYLNHSHHKLLRLADHLDFYNQSDADLALLYPSTTLDLSGLCRELERILTYLANQTGHTFSYREAKSSLLISGNEFLLHKLIYNLTSNALRAGGDVTMRLEKKGTQAVLTLTDNGGGIDLERLSRSQDRSLMESIQGGFGLGLPICHRIALLSGGRLAATPRKKGTIFSLSIPLCTGKQSQFLRSGTIFHPEQSYNQVLVELSDVLPSSCYGQESVF